MLRYLARSSTTSAAAVASPAQHDAPLPPPSQPYIPPTTGLLSYLPAAAVPYAELIRLDKPTGTLYLLVPCIWSTLLAATLTTPTASPGTVLYTCGLFSIGAVIMRGAGCTINDLWDRRIDPLVSRTRLRPIARGAISARAGVIFTGAQLLAGLALLLQFPRAAVAAAIPSLLPVTVYPLMKRITHYPQVVLGLSFSWGALLGPPALGVDLMEPRVTTAAGLLYASNVAWTVLYDTIYAHQDVLDDKKAGVKSTAVRWAGSTKGALAALAAVQISCLAGAGVAAGAGPVFFVGGCGGAAALTAWMIRRVRLGSPEDCWAWFRWCAWAVGGVAIGGGLAAEYAVRRWSEGREGEGELEGRGLLDVVA